MFTSTTLIWLRRMLVLGAVVAGATASAAGAVGRPPDVRDTAGARLAEITSRPPDVRDTALGESTVIPDVVDRYVARHSTEAGLSATESLVSQPPDIQDAVFSSRAAVPDVFERFVASHASRPSLGSVSISRPPDVGDAALSVQYGSTVESKTGFDWNDWAIGIGSGLGLALLLAACVLLGGQLRRRVQTA